MYIKDFENKEIVIKNKKNTYVFSYIARLDCFFIKIYKNKLIDEFIISCEILDLLNKKDYSFDSIFKNHPIQKDIFIKFRKKLTVYNGE